VRFRPTLDQTLLQEGAKEHNLPEEYQAYLRSIPHYVPRESRLHRAGAALFLFFGRRMVSWLARKVKRSINTAGRCPDWYGTLILVTYTFMWWWHDWVFAPIFGSGSGGQIRFGCLQLYS
jgi:gliotoxin/aspirochlorine biosynthesis gamma-glutamylcyclotransferase